MTRTPSTSAQIKKELKAAFPGTKFSVRKRNYSSIYVKWTRDLGSEVTLKEVKKVAQKYDTCRNLEENPYVDPIYVGTSVYFDCEYTEELEAYTIEFVKNYWVDCDRYESGNFYDEYGQVIFSANQMCREYLNNGISSDLIDEYGCEPYEKTDYYRQLEEEQQQQEEVIEGQEGMSFEERLTAVEQRLAALEGKEQGEDKVLGFEERLAAIEERLTVLEEEVSLNGVIEEKPTSKVVNIFEAFGKQEPQKQQPAIDENEEEMSLEEIEQNLIRLTQEQAMITAEINYYTQLKQAKSKKDGELLRQCARRS